MSCIRKRSMTKKSRMRMILSKRNPKTLTQFRFYIILNELKLKNMGRIENIHRIANSGLSWQSMIEWAKRISFYEGKRGETLEYYTIIHNDEKIAAEKMKKKSENISGDKNPWYDHGGKYSPWKKGSVNYSEEAVNKAKENATYNTTLIYYLKKGFGLCQSIKMLKERQAVGRLDKFISRYGEEEGLARWKARQEKWMKTLNTKSIEEKARINSLKCSSGYTVSKAEKEIFNALKIIFPKITKSLALPYNNNKNYYVYDMILNNKIIEYNGDIWHANPMKFDIDYINPISKQTASEIWEKELNKESVANQHGYVVMKVWESDFRQNKEKVLQECISFLNQ